eukprot:CAMPEP_0201284088 /NCGR_PEP_ID=MMETSP1317-20130820/61345_1 /ASSEMBLY_ACC=CAM_ASM_000770 /TAXON_ID=187299 /ORGANISM="Undescribed Undescribed, Strain Undescribed" /LENGTH=88 /DNA_ID=CAMNT_0047602731 /DNA_START=161 /DNA_END=427 /DNA_ORIENTATION=+
MDEAYGLFYEEALFLSWIVQHWNFDIQQLSPAEAADYSEAVTKLNTWKQLKDLWDEVELLVKEIRQLQWVRKYSHYATDLYKFPDIEE